MTIEITPALLKKLAPTAKASIINPLATLLNDEQNQQRFKLDDPWKMAMFLGHTALESGGFTALEENLNYSVKGLRRVWPSRFKTDKAAAPYANNPRALANFVYGGRMGNRPGTDDGWDTRGMGLKQTTGMENTRSFDAWAKKNLPGAPDFMKDRKKLLEFPWAFYSAVYYWISNNVWKWADKWAAAKTAKEIDAALEGSTRSINGGLNGHADRVIYINRARKLLIPREDSVKVDTKPKGADQTVKEYQLKLNEISKIRDDDQFNVGKADGWMGTKTEKAVKHFQEETGYLKVDGVLGDETREAIDNFLVTAKSAKVAPLADTLAMSTVAATAPVVVEEKPVDIPTRLYDTLDKNVLQNPNVKAYALGSGSIVTLAWNVGTAWFERQSEVVQVAILLLVAGTIFYAVKGVIALLRSKKGFKELKQKVAVAEIDQAANAYAPTDEEAERAAQFPVQD